MGEKRERVKYHIYFDVETERDVINFLESVIRPMRSKLVVVALRMLKQWLESQPEHFSSLFRKKTEQDIEANSGAKTLKDSSEILDKKLKRTVEVEEEVNSKESLHNNYTKDNSNGIEEIDFSKIFRF